MSERLFTRDEAIQELRNRHIWITYRTLRQWEQQGLLPRAPRIWFGRHVKGGTNSAYTTAAIDAIEAFARSRVRFNHACPFCGGVFAE